MRLLVLAISSLALATTAVLADPIADRKALMKERGGIVGGLSKVTKGEEAFDAAKVLAALSALHANAEKFDADALFPAGSDQGDTRALPKIWEDMAGFKAAAEKYETATAAAVAAAPQDVEALKVQVAAIGQGCGGCHEAYRRPSN
ncbi:MAG: cytochrome c prime [Rhizobiaceae bacterium]|jgi:cytochrome c556|nr:cytochrome c prime [Rhizobiaceae bacterium]